MGARVFSEEEVRAIVASLEQVAIATRGDIVVAVNQAWTAFRGFRAEQAEGRSVGQLVAAEERERLIERANAPAEPNAFDDPLHTIVRDQRGVAFPVCVYTSRFPAAEQPEFRISIVLPDTSPGLAAVFSRELLSLSADLIGARSAADVREHTIRAFERAGLRARFWRRGSNFDGVVLAIAERAMADNTPVFAGAQAAPDAVYVPLGKDEILHVTGPELTGQHAYAFGFFGKLIATSLLDVQASEAARRKLDDTELVLQLARTTSESLDLDVVMGLTADSLVKLLDMSNCVILLYDEKEKVLRGAGASHGRRDVVKDIAIALDDVTNIAAKTARERHVVVIPDSARDPLGKRASLDFALYKTAVTAIPMVSHGSLTGVVILDETRGRRNFSPEWIELASAMVAQVGLSIANARLYESLRKSYEELDATRAEMVQRERLAGLGELAAIVAHEVRNPLGVIYNATNSLERLVGQSSDGMTLVGIVREECERLNQIVGDLIDFARPRQLSRSPEDIERVLGEVIDALGETPGVQFDVRVASDLPVVLIDRRLMRQALLNVAINGVQAMPQGGTLHLDAQLHAQQELMVLEIRDEGAGIRDGDLPRIFEPFFTTKASGAGLGLAVVKRNVEEHGGHVTVRSTPQGTTFCFRLPLSRAT